MTTIAWDGKTLAGDTQRSWGTFKEFVPSKIYRLRDGSILGGAGDVGAILTALEYLEKKPEKKPEINEGLSLIYVTKEGAFHLGDKLVAVPLPSKFAVGTGSDFAIAAMFLGLPAEQAVMVACELDSGSGGAVTTLELDNA